MSLGYLNYGFWIRDPGSGKNLFRIPQHCLLSLVELGGASFIEAAEHGSVSTPPTAGQAHEAPVNETHLRDEGHAPATMHANCTPFTVDGAAGIVGAAAAAGVGAAAAAGVDAAEAERVGDATAAAGTASDACTPYDERRRSPVSAGLDSTPRGPTHPPPPPGPPPAQSHMAPEIEAKNSLISLILRLGCFPDA